MLVAGGWGSNPVFERLSLLAVAETLEKPEFEMGEGDALLSVEWLPESSSQLVAGCLYTNKLKRFDLKEKGLNCQNQV